MQITFYELRSHVSAHFFRRRGLSPALIAEQQRVADLFFEQGVIPKKINIKDALLPRQVYAAITPPEIMV